LVKEFLTLKLIKNVFIVSKNRLLELFIVSIAVLLKDFIALLLLVEVEVLFKTRLYAVDVRAFGVESGGRVI